MVTGLKNKSDKLRKLARDTLKAVQAEAQRIDAPVEFPIHMPKTKGEPRIYPSADVVFSFITADDVVFTALMESIMDEKVKLSAKPTSQVTRTAWGGHDNNIRLDVCGETQKWIMATEMQNDPRRALVEDRSPYYHAVLMAGQNVDDMRYDELKAVSVTFIMPTKTVANSIGVKHLEWADVTTGRFEENSDRRYFLYIPNLLDNEAIEESNPTLYMFARFYAILAQEQADAFLRDYKDNPIARRLIFMSNALFKRKMNVNALNNIPYFDRKALVAKIHKVQDEKIKAEAERVKAEAERVNAEAERVKAEAERVKAETRIQDLEKKLHDIMISNEKNNDGN